ncbi:hemerythrin domain-containing protein [Proteobacteria bacterium 005FR1]|nr:hemerythrin domain-containing protein [Proteobacteria bacterium 005FR1]
MDKNAISLLKQEHEEVKKLLNKLMETSSGAAKTRTDLLEKIATKLRAHTKIEEEILYPALRDAGSDKEKKMYHEAVEEHRAVEELVLPDLEKTDPSSNEFAGRAKVLKELLEHHIDEEESELFPDVEQLFEASQLKSMGEKMADLKQQYLH